MKNIFDFFSKVNHETKHNLIKTLEILVQFKSINLNELIKCLSIILNVNEKQLKENVFFFEFIGAIRINEQVVELKDEYLNEPVDYEKYIIEKFHVVFNEHYPVADFFSYEWSDSMKCYILSKKIPLNFSSYRDFLIAFDCLLYCADRKDYVIIDNRFYKYLKLKKSLKDLEKELENKKVIGELGEEFVTKFEMIRLRDKKGIKKISNDDVTAGYDIKSFDNVDSFSYDRFIEVKTYSSHMRIYLSSNEIETAKRLQDFYFLYLVDITLIDNNDYEPIIIKNPYKCILGNNNLAFKVETISYDVYDLVELMNINFNFRE